MTQSELGILQKGYRPGYPVGAKIDVTVTSVGGLHLAPDQTGARPGCALVHDEGHRIYDVPLSWVNVGGAGPAIAEQAALRPGR